jgi:hypothetical protein
MQLFCRQFLISLPRKSLEATTVLVRFFILRACRISGAVCHYAAPLLASPRPYRLQPSRSLDSPLPVLLNAPVAHLILRVCPFGMLLRAGGRRIAENCFG